MSEQLLHARGICKSFGAQRVLVDVDLDVKPGEIVGLLGPNGSGKSTLLNVLSGFYTADAGRTLLGGDDLSRAAMHKRARMGLVRTFQLPSMPARLTTWEVLLAGSNAYASAVSALWRTAAQREAAQAARVQAERLLLEFRLSAVRDQPAAALSGGQKKLLGIATALMSRPRLLCLDEPTAGVHPNLRREMVDMLQRCCEQGTAILVIEHDMGFIGELCHRCVVLDRGQVIANCSPRDLARDPRVVSAYLGRVEEPVERAA